MELIVAKEKYREYYHCRNPEEVRTFENGKLELVNIGGGIVGLFTLEPGWRWSAHVKSNANTVWSEAPHLQYQLSGRLRVTMDDGTEFETVEGNVSSLSSGHDAWVVGEDPVVVVDWSGGTRYAKKN